MVAKTAITMDMKTKPTLVQINTEQVGLTDWHVSMMMEMESVTVKTLNHSKQLQISKIGTVTATLIMRIMNR